MIWLALLAGFFAALYVIWRVWYRYPPLGVPQVLCYHKLSDRFCLEGTWITRSRFLGHIDYLLDQGVRFVDEATFINALGGTQNRGSTDILLTFDDGYEALHPMYFEHLVPRNIPLLVFLPTDYAGRENTWDLSLGRRAFRHLSWIQVREMCEAGVDFGAHGVTHRDLTRLDEVTLDHEITQSKRAIEEQTNRSVRSFSYPFGRYNDAVREAVRRSGYQIAFSLYPHHPNEHMDRFALRRNGVYVIDTAHSLNCKLNRTSFFWFEEMKCRVINGVAALTPLLKHYSTDRDT